jgi:hypothetical protein
MTTLTSLILHQISAKYDSQRNTHIILLLIMVRVPVMVRNPGANMLDACCS